MSVKINTLEVENVKRIRAVQLVPSESGLTVIGGNNAQGKTSVLDTICWALGGERYRPSNPTREGSTVPPRIKLTLSNGLIVERSGKNSALKVTDPSGRKSGQQLLNEFVSELALNLPRFLEASPKEKANTLLQIIGVGSQLAQLEQEEQQLYNQRLLLGREADRKQKYAEGLPFYPDTPKEPVSITELIQIHQARLARNGENQRKRQQVEQIRLRKERAEQNLESLNRQLLELQAKIGGAQAELKRLTAELEIAAKDAMELQDESTEELERDIAGFEAINAKVRSNLDREKAMDEAHVLAGQYESMTGKIEAVRQRKRDLLNGANLPLPELGVEGGELTYQGKRWDCMSGAAQMKVATAIVRAIKPACGFVLMDGLEAMDVQTLTEFGLWAEKEGLQIIATRVSTGPECQILIDDGRVTDSTPAAVASAPSAPRWQPGVF